MLFTPHILKKKLPKREGDILLKEKLIACYNLFFIKSGYFWENKMVFDNKFVGIFKTTKDNWPILKKRIKAIHPYKVPCILKFEVEVNRDYYQWIIKALK